VPLCGSFFDLFLSNGRNNPFTGPSWLFGVLIPGITIKEIDNLGEIVTNNFQAHDQACFYYATYL